MLKNIIKAFHKAKDDALPKALYDLGKYLFILMTTYLIVLLFPKDNFLGLFFTRTLIMQYWQFGIFTVCIILISVWFSNLLNRNYIKKIKQDIYTDELTDLPNHKALSQRLPDTIEWAKNEKKIFSLILMDIDDFKKINSSHSYENADKVLSKFGNLLRNDSRATDITFRQHAKGDEFIIIAKETSLQNAVLAANRKRELVQNTSFEIPGVDSVVTLTICCGVVEYNILDDSETILKRAHRAMMSAKTKDGKNNVMSLM